VCEVLCGGVGRDDGKVDGGGGGRQIRGGEHV
jgi:hypothetical protein